MSIAFFASAQIINIIKTIIYNNGFLKNMICTDIFNYYHKNRFFDAETEKRKYNYYLHHLRFFQKNTDEIEYTDLVNYSKIRQKKVKNSTINKELSFARASINFYNKTNRTEVYNPFSNFRLFEPEPNVRYLTYHEALKLLNASMQHKNLMLFYYLQLLLLTGCRSKELLTLTWDNVFLDSDSFVVKNYLSKSRKTIFKPINSDAKLIFLKLKKYHYKYVFYNENTGKNYQSFAKGFRLARDRANLGYLRLHDLRHTHASWLAQKNVSLVKIQRILGHQDLSSTQRYAHFANSDLLEASNKISLS